MKKINGNNIIKILLIISLCIFTICVINKTFQNDTYTVITEGNKILNNGFDKECGEWIFFVIVALIYNIFGFLGIYIFTVIISIVIALSIFYVLRKRNINIILCFFMTIFIIYSLGGSLTARAQLLSFIVLIWEYHFINKLIETSKKRYLIVITVLGIIMTNVHAPLFPIYVILFLPYIAQIMISKFKVIMDRNDLNKIIVEKNNSDKLFLITFFISLFTGLITPLNKNVAYFSSFSFLKEDVGNYIVELQPLIITNGLLFYVIIFMAISILLLTRTKIRIADLLFLFGFGILSLVIGRNIIYFTIFGIIALAKVINDFFNEYKMYEIELKSKIKGVLLSLSIIIIILFGMNIFVKNLNNDYFDEELCPVYACDFLINNYDISKINIYNSFNTGAYINFRGIKPFITSANSNGKKMQDFIDIENVKVVRCKEIFDEYGITHILTDNMELVLHMKENSEYKIIYQDDIYFIMERI